MIINKTRVSPDTVRVEVNDVIVGFALRLGNGMWRAYAPDMVMPVSDDTFKAPKSAIKALIAAAL
jgi:hypothetical protein